MLRFTPAGAVTAPTTLQIRVTRRFPGRLAAGAPIPARSLSDEELVDNLVWFTDGMRGPRTAPCTALVLSGLRIDRRPGLGRVLDRARQLQITRVVLHLGPRDAARIAGTAVHRRVDAVSARVGSAGDAALLAAAPGGRGETTAVVVLAGRALDELDGIADTLTRSVGPAPRIVFTWPFPPAEGVPSAARAAARLMPVLDRLVAREVEVGVKGLAACHLPRHHDRVWRSANRWYQQQRALLFCPDVVRFAKAETCRFCARAHCCDGVAEPWLRAGVAGALRPIPMEPAAG